MGMVRIASSIFVGLLLVTSSALAAAPSCETVVDALMVESDSAKVADALNTTRARVNACAVRRQMEQRHDERRSRLWAERAARGLH